MSFYRLKTEFDPGHGREIVAAGSLLFPWRADRNEPPARTVKLSVDPKGWGYSMFVPVDQVERDPQPKAHEFDTLLRYAMVGAEPPPNCVEGTPETLEKDLDAFAHLGSLIGAGYGATYGGRIMLPSMRGNPNFTHYGQIAVAFVSKTQGGALTGEARVLLQLGWNGKGLPRMATFKLCDHAIQKGHGARPERGWHPSRCTKCGLDTTVDSSD